MKRKAGLVLFLFLDAATLCAEIPQYPFYPKPEINRLVYEVNTTHWSSTVSGAKDTSSKYILELEITRDSSLGIMIINGRDSGYGRNGTSGLSELINVKYTDTC